MFSFLTLFLAFGLGLDPRNAGAFGPGLAPILIGISSAINVFSGAIARPGYLGACKALLPSINRRLAHSSLTTPFRMQPATQPDVWPLRPSRTISSTITSIGRATSPLPCKCLSNLYPHASLLQRIWS